MDLKEGVSQVSLTGGGIGHTKAVTSIDTHQDNLLLLTGSEDETAKLINSNNGKVSNVASQYEMAKSCDWFSHEASSAVPCGILPRKKRLQMLHSCYLPMWSPSGPVSTLDIISRIT